MKTSKNKSVFIVDDDSALLQLYVQILQGEDIAAAGFSSGKEALAKIGESALPDLILVDYLMPGMTGHEFIKELELRIPELRTSTKLVGISGLVASSAQMQAFETLVDAIESKPSDLDEFLKITKKHLGILEK